MYARICCLISYIIIISLLLKTKPTKRIQKKNTNLVDKKIQVGLELLPSSARTTSLKSQHGVVVN